MVGIEIKALAAAACLAGPLALAAASIRAPAEPQGAHPAVVELPAGTFLHRAAGDFTRGGKPATAPMVTVEFRRPLSIMKHQVTAGDYRRCVDAGACAASDTGEMPSDRPAVRVSWRDAQAYAAWLSGETGAHYRLPTDEEWAYAAGSRLRDDALPEDAGDPGQRALARYEKEASRDEPVREVLAVGSFGANERGLLDIAGNVWEWTNTCFVRSALDGNGQAAGPSTTNCGVRVVEGRHRTYMTDFVRE